MSADCSRLPSAVVTMRIPATRWMKYGRAVMRMRLYFVGSSLDERALTMGAPAPPPPTTTTFSRLSTVDIVATDVDLKEGKLSSHQPLIYFPTHFVHTTDRGLAVCKQDKATQNDLGMGRKGVHVFHT